jgi:hypothetical protein
MGHSADTVNTSNSTATCQITSNICDVYNRVAGICHGRFSDLVVLFKHSIHHVLSEIYYTSNTGRFMPGNRVLWKCAAR